jgi:hypothetical protein
VKYSIRIRALQPSSSQESGNGISVLAWKFIFVVDIALFFSDSFELAYFWTYKNNLYK